MSDPKIIYLGPACQKEGDGREWCEDDVWPQCECGCSSVRYVLESDVQSELAALREELAELEEEFDTLEHANVTLKLSLAAAEQRNAELGAAIVALPDEFKDLSGCENTAGVYACIDYISDWVAELSKPTESGASE